MDDRLDDRLRELAGEYNKPPETPREAMWERIVAERSKKAEPAAPAEGANDEGSEPRVLPFRRFHYGRPFQIAAGIAAVLALGIGLGRLTVHPPKTAPAPVSLAAERPKVNAAAYRVVTTEHLSQSEEFLTLFRASVRVSGMIAWPRRPPGSFWPTIVCCWIHQPQTTLPPGCCCRIWSWSWRR